VNLCPQHDPTGTLTLVATDVVWEQQPENLTNLAQVLAGTHPAAYRARPTWTMPVTHANNAASTTVLIYRQELTRFNEYTLASKALAKVLLDSIGRKNQVLLKTLHPTLKIYAFTPHQIVDAMFDKHGIPQSEDIIKLRSSLDLALTSLSDLENHMTNFLLACQRLTRSGQGKTPYEYFETYLVTVLGFPSEALAMMGYYARYPAISQQNLATLFPFLNDIKDHLATTDPASPFSGAARGPAQTPARRPGKKNNKRDRKQGQKPTQQSSSTTRWGPTGAVNLAESAPVRRLVRAIPEAQLLVSHIR
jgi:hypothetical protein